MTFILITYCENMKGKNCNVENFGGVAAPRIAGECVGVVFVCGCGYRFDERRLFLKMTRIVEPLRDINGGGCNWR